MQPAIVDSNQLPASEPAADYATPSTDTQTPTTEDLSHDEQIPDWMKVDTSDITPPTTNESVNPETDI